MTAQALQEIDTVPTEVERWAKDYLASHDRSKAVELRHKIDECIELADKLYDYEDDACNIGEAIDKLVLAYACINEVACPRYYPEDDGCCEVFYIDDEGEIQILPEYIPGH